jgi:L-ascorbate metabolism protein UlaG (beta-lactamase superfamily)
MKITYLGHSCVFIETGSHRLIIDPFLTGNENAAAKADDIRCDYILLTHGHDDHVGDAPAIAKRNEATLIANFEIADYFGGQGLKTHGMYIGGAHQFPFGRVKFTIAHHGSSLGTDKGRIYMGNPAGILLTLEGKTVYHAGDTGIFLDMKLIGEMDPIDLAFLPVGDNFTMGVDDAAKAVEFLKPRIAVPIHYNTWPIIAADPEEFARKATAAGAQGKALRPGESLEL